MASYHFTAKVVSRAKGQSATAKAAYNARDKLVDERTGETKDYRNAGEVVFSGIFAPEDAPQWAHDRQELWNQVERSEKRRDAQTALELELALPHQLTDEQRRNIVVDFAREKFLRKQLVADVSIHPPPREPEEGKQPNHHVHILVALRETGPDGFGERVINSGSLEENARQIDEWREKWAERGARELRKAGFELEADRYEVGHLTLPEQREAALERGDVEWAEHCNREPTEHRGPAVDAMQRKGIDTERGRDIREEQLVQHQHEAEREAQWWQRIEQAIERGGGYEEARRNGWLNQPYGPDLEHMREFRQEIVGMRQENARELDDGSISKEHRAALREIAGDLRDLHLDTSKKIATLALEQSAYEPAIIEMGRARLNDFADTIKGAGREVADLAAGVFDMAGKAVEAVVDFFITPSLPTPELMAARREAAEAKIERGEYEARSGKEDDAGRVRNEQQEELKAEREARKYKEKQERELFPNEREREM